MALTRVRSPFSSVNSPDVVVDLIGRDTTDTVPINLHVRKLNYSITDVPGKWWQKMTHLQMPWEWTDVGRKIHILNDVSFTAKSGQLMAVMGGSGSGKTSLLDVLSYRADMSGVSGGVYLNSITSSKRILDSCSGYVRQDDRLIAFLTVRETLMFVAQLKLPKTFSKAQIKERVDQVIAELGLMSAADTKVGDASQRGLSGGERRRVSIGIQLLIMPSILFLDEPTSGLDSFTATNITQTLSRLTTKKRTIIMSIHQPRFDIFNIVDVIMILSKGQIVYNGPGREMIQYFTSLGFPCPDLVNPCDFYIDLATVDNTSLKREEKSLATLNNLIDAFQLSVAAQEELNYNAEEIISSAEVEECSELVAKDGSQSPPGLFTQFTVLYKRFFRVTIDDYVTLASHVIQSLVMSLLLGTAYVSLKKDQLSVRDWFSCMFMVTVMYPYMVVLGLIGTCHDERKFFYFELQDRLYTPVAYYFAKVLSDLPFHLLYVVVYCVPVYAMAGLTVDAFSCFTFYAVVSMSVFTSRCLSMMTAALLPTYQLSCFVAQTIYSLCVMSSGFLININNVIEGTRWIPDINYIRWGFEALCLVEIKDLTFECSSPYCIRNGEDALKYFGFDGGELWRCAIGLGATMLTFLLIMLLSFHFIPQKPHNE